ncbi:hypothetical protein SKAU_G00429480 [Synaphobranchus kaupii]|uniref:Uncharacterized protein n=1 Tax=Synaphobranchus kaupii TaxID=118154 RepID=A0A9Q1E4K1_SYNKA|nr:hypothetical protein SKAU_G00429480 [Synaphobranchus kaupii]
METVTHSLGIGASSLVHSTGDSHSYSWEEAGPALTGSELHCPTSSPPVTVTDRLHSSPRDGQAPCPIGRGDGACSSPPPHPSAAGLQ